LIRPYHTLLFPNSSPSEVLKGLMDGVNDMTTSPSISHSLRRILPHMQPRKSLHEIAWDAGLSLPYVMDAANLLVQSGICVAVMPVLRKNRYACADGVVSKMSSLALPFWQSFGVRSKHCKFYWGGETAGGSEDTDDDTTLRERNFSVGAPHVFVIVSALTTSVEDGSAIMQNNGNRVNVSSSPTLGQAIDSLSGVDEPTLNDASPHYQHSDNFQYGESRHVLRQSPNSAMGNMNPLHLNLPSSRGGISASASSGVFDTTTDEIVYSMAVWLIANKIIVEVKDFLVAAEAFHDSCTDGNKPPDAVLSEESLYHELLHSGCLNGTKSIPAICYQFGLDRFRIEKFIAWGQRTNKLEIVRRVDVSNET